MSSAEATAREAGTRDPAPREMAAREVPALRDDLGRGRSRLLRRGSGHRRKQRHGGSHFGGHAGSGEHRRRSAEAVAHHAELRGMHADLTGSQPHARHDIQGDTQVKRQIHDRRHESALGVRRSSHDAPGRQVLQQAPVVARAGQPVVAEGDSGQVQSGFRGVHDTGQTGKGQVTA